METLRQASGGTGNRFGHVELVVSRLNGPIGENRHAPIRVQVRNQRLHDIAPALIGKPAAAAPQICRRLLPLCGWAQGIACLSAIEAALDTRPDPATRQARELLICAEAATGAVWRAAVDWPELLGRRPELRCLHYARKALEVMIGQLWQGGDPLDLAARAGPITRAEAPIAALIEAMETVVLPHAPSTAEAFEHWALNAPASLPELLRRGVALDLPGLVASASFPDLEQIAASLAAAPAFGSFPHHSGRPCEPANPRNLPAGIVRLGPVGARYLAQALAARSIAESLDTLVAPPVQSLRPSERTGVAQVEGLRGPLIHRVVVDCDQRIAAFASVAPIEWMLHPDGALAQLVGAAIALGKAESVPLIVAAFDPCVPVRVADGSDSPH